MDKEFMNAMEKDHLIDLVAEALENDGMALVFTDTKGAGVHFIQGNAVKIINLIVRGMEKDKRINFIINKAVDFKREVLDKRSAKKSDGKIPDIFDDPLDCENCDRKDNCDIRENIPGEQPNLGELFKLFDPAELDKIMKEMMIQKIKKRN